MPGGQSVSAWAVQVHQVVPLAFPVTAMADRADDEASRISVAVRCRPLSDHAPRAKNTEPEKTANSIQTEQRLFLMNMFLHKQFALYLVVIFE